MTTPTKTTVPPDNEAAFSIAMFGKRYGIGRSTVYEEIRNGRLKLRKCGARSLILREDAERWAASLPEVVK